MEYGNLGKTGLKVSRICIGMGLRKGRDNAICRTTVERAIDSGINFIDTANVYGEEGRGERIVGEVLKEGGRRDQLVISTKVWAPVGPGPNDHGLSRVHIMREVERSLSRLQTDYVDVYLMHHPDPTTPTEETLRALDDVIHQGKVRYIGCSNHAAWQVCKALWVSDRLNVPSFVCTQNLYNILDRSVERELMPCCRSEGLGIMVYSPLAVGILTGGDAASRTSPKEKRVIEALERIGKERGKTVAQVAMAWVLSHPEVSTSIVGTSDPKHLEENVGSVGWTLSPEERTALDELPT